MINRRRLSSGLGIVLPIVSFFVAGMLRIYVNPALTHQRGVVGNDDEYVGYVTNVSISSGKQFVGLKSLDNNQLEVNLITSAYPHYRLGEVLAVKGELNKNRLIFPEIHKGRSKGFSLGIWVLRVRQAIIDAAARVLPQPYLGVVMGVVFGIKDALLDSTKDLFRNSGIIHILVASGYNISVLIAFISAIFSFLSRRLRAIVVFLVMLTYAAISGFDPPIVRASIMGVATLLAMSLGRQKLSFLWLIYSAILMVLVLPAVLTSVSFQLSFAATLAIILFNDRLEKLLVLVPSIVRTDLATTMSAQILTTPIIWLQFGRIQPLSIIVNSLILWSVPFIMLFGSLCVAAVFVYMPLAKLFSMFSMMLIDYVFFIARGFSF